MNCLIIDDEPMACEILKTYCKKTPFLNLVEVFEDAVSALTWLQSNPVDLIFLDINMPDLSGLEFVQALSHRPLIIFTTAYEQHALKGFELDAVDYLLKPIGFDRFLKAASKAQRRLNTEESSPQTEDEPFIFLKSGHRHVRIEIAEIRFIISEKNYISVYTGKEKVMALLSMDKILAMLPKDGFARIHKSYIVNLRHVDIVEKHSLRIGQEEIPIGESYKKAFFRLIGR